MHETMPSHPYVVNSDCVQQYTATTVQFVGGVCRNKVGRFWQERGQVRRYEKREFHFSTLTTDPGYFTTVLQVLRTYDVFYFLNSTEVHPERTEVSNLEEAADQQPHVLTHLPRTVKLFTNRNTFESCVPVSCLSCIQNLSCSKSKGWSFFLQLLTTRPLFTGVRRVMNAKQLMLEYTRWLTK